MLEYISGTIEKLNPTFLIIENSGIGYFCNISLFTYGKLQEGQKHKLLIHEIIREDQHTLYAFSEEKEREIFRALISVSGVGANTARMMLSKLTPDETEIAILNGDVNLLKSIKGIGTKSAQRVIVDLKDKVGKGISLDEILNIQDNTSREESLSALVMLGFPKSMVEKVVDKILREQPTSSVEEIIKLSLNRL